MPKRKVFMILMDAFFLASLYNPLMALMDLASGFVPSGKVLFMLPVLSALLCFFILLNEDRKTALKKWGLSVLFTLLFSLFLGWADFELRLVNTIYPGYGRLSAGAGFAIIVDFFFFSITQIVGNLLAVCCSGDLPGPLKRLRAVLAGRVVPVVCVILWGVILYLHCTMLPAEAIYASYRY